MELSVLERKRQAVTAERRADVQARMLTAVEQLLDGPRRYPELAVRELLDAGDISRQTFYVYFKDKGDLLAQLADRVVTELITRSLDFWTLPLAPSRDTLRQRMRPVFELYRAHGTLLIAIADAAGSDDQVRDKLSSLVGMAAAAFALAIENGQQQGEMRPTLNATSTAAWLLWMAERGLAQLAVGTPPEQLDEVFEGLVDVLWFTLYPQSDL